MDTATLKLLDALKIKSEPLATPLSANAGVAEKLEETIVPSRNYKFYNPTFPQMGRIISVAWHIKMH